MRDKTLPWNTEASDSQPYDAAIYGHRGTIPVLIADVMVKDEAAFIVRAVNCHDDLVAALKRARAYVVNTIHLEADLAAIDAALSRAEQPK